MTIRSEFFTSSFLALPILLFSANPSADDQYLAETDFFGEAPIVLTVSRMHKPLSNAPVSVTIIDREMIENSGAREVADIFRMVPGFIVGYENGLRPAVTYQGLGQIYSRRMQVLVDGRSVFIPSFGGVPWSNLPLLLHDIERVEITRGPNAVTYGTNAFLATINIITRHASEDLGGEVIVTHDLDTNKNVQDVYARYGNHYGDLDWRLTFGREQDDGIENILRWDADKETLDSKVVDKLNIRTDFLTAANQFWTIQAGINDSIFEIGDGRTDSPYRDETTVNTYQNIQWELIEPEVQTTVKLTNTRQEVKGDYFASLQDFSTLVPVSRTSNRTDLEIYQNCSFSDNLTLNYGFNVRRDEIRSLFAFNTNETFEVDSRNVFTSMEWHAPSETILDFGVFIEDSDVITNSENSYRLSVIHPIDSHHLRFVSSSAKRLPILWEQIGNVSLDVTVDPTPTNPALLPIAGMTIPFKIDYLNNGGLIAETIRSNEIGVLSRFKDSQLTTDIKIFEYRIEDIIETSRVSFPLLLDPNHSYDTMVNGGTLKVRGTEIFFNYSPKSQDLRVYGGYTIMRADGNRADRDHEKSYPERIGYLGGHVELDQQQKISATLYYVDDMSWADSSTDLSDYERLDLRYQYLLDRKRDVRLELIGYNVIDDYTEYRGYSNRNDTLLIRLSGKF